MIPDESRMRALVGHRFPGGTYGIEHWENFLLSEATGVEPLPERLVHPAHLFHVAINGVGHQHQRAVSARSVRPRRSPVSIDYYDWRVQTPLREDEPYTLAGGITGFVREPAPREGGVTRDAFVYEIALDDAAGARVADVAFRWFFWRTEPTGDTR